MKKWKILAFVPAIVALVAALIFPNLFRIENPTIEAVNFVVGSLAALIVIYFVFESKQLFLYVIAGTIFGTIASYGFDFFPWSSYPQLSIVIFVIVLLLAIVFWCLASYKGFLELRKRFQ